MGKGEILKFLLLGDKMRVNINKEIMVSENLRGAQRDGSVELAPEGGAVSGVRKRTAAQILRRSQRFSGCGAEWATRTRGPVRPVRIESDFVGGDLPEETFGPQTIPRDDEV